MTGEATGPLGRARALFPTGDRRHRSGPAHVVIDASLTDVWRRRVLAAVIDLGLVAVVLVTLTLLQVQRLTRDSAGLLSPADIDRWNTLAAMPNRQVTLGSTTYVLAGAELIMTVLITVILAVAVFVLIPAYTGTSPGKRSCGLRVVTIRGGVVGLSHTGLRTLLGLVDFLPAVVPWALGARLAQRSPWHQRLGDRIAGTAVIDARRLLTVTAAEPKETVASASVAAMTAATAPAIPEAAPPVTRGTPAPTDAGAEGTSTAVPVITAGPSPAGGGPVRSSRSAAPATSDGAARVELFAPVPGVTTGTASPARRAAPPPQHRRSTATTPDSAAGPTADSSWVAPRAEPAPVWDPTSAGEAPSRAWLGDLAAALTPTRSETRPPTAPAAAGASEDPVWSDEWQAWLCFDREHGRWHRHDAAADAWVAIG